MSKKIKQKQGKHAYRQFLSRQKAEKSMIQLAPQDPETGKEVIVYQSE